MEESKSGPPDSGDKTEAIVPKPEKKHRRRSSIGSEILSAFINGQDEETMSPVEPKLSRPRRAAQLRSAVVFQMPPVVPRKKPVRYSFDLGERVETKSCLKPSTAPILIRKGPTPKSSTQRAAQRILEKYRKSRSMSRTPQEDKESRLRFDQICTIRIITPRPNYDPEHLEMPHSDDEEDSLNPHRERLSTVELRLTPTSEAMLQNIQDDDVVQFHAEMVFGDNQELVKKNPAVTSSEAVALTSSGSTALLTLDNASESSVSIDAPGISEPPKPLELITEQPRKKNSRRKSLIVGGASPLKLQVIERPRFEEDIDDEISEPKRKTRRSLRISSAQIHGRTEDEEQLYDEPITLDSQTEKSEKTSNKRELIVDNVELVGPSSLEPQPKRNRKSVVPSNTENRRKTIIPENEPIEKQKKKPENFFAPKTRKTSDSCRKRRSTRLVVAEVPPTHSEVVTAALNASETSSSESSDALNEGRKPVEPQATAPEVPITSKPMNLAPMFRKSLASTKKPEKSEPLIQQTSDIFNLKNEETNATSSPAPKLFALFAKPKSSKPLETPAPIIDLTSHSPKISTSMSSVISSFSSSSRTSGIRREATWGDSHPEMYQFIQNSSKYPSIFSESQLSSVCPQKQNCLKWKAATAMQIDANLEYNFLMKKDQEHRKDTVVPSSVSVPTEKLNIDECDPLSVYPPTMDQLVEGAEEEKKVRGWLRKWKRKVRKEAENEISEGKKKEKKKKRKHDKEEDSDDEDYEEEENGGDLENPLVLIGPTGVGKTALIKALAKQENMRCLTTGPESLRTGREMKERLREAMRTHRVDQQAHRKLTFFYSSGSKVYTHKEKSPAVTTDEKYTQTLIVIEHVDVFFESIDKHGIGGLLEMVNEARVPIVFTCEKEWPKRWGQIELERRPLEIWMGRNEKKTQEYVQKIIYSSRGVHLDPQTIASLSASVGHDLRALIRQAHFYSLAPDLPLPLTSRVTVSDGFTSSWDFDARNIEIKMEGRENLVAQYAEILEYLPTSQLPNLPQIERFWDAETREFEARKAKFAENVQSAHDALYGRFTRREVALDVLPMLMPMDRVERKKISGSRRHLHRFRHESDVPMDGDTLMSAVAKLNIK